MMLMSVITVPAAVTRHPWSRPTHGWLRSQKRGKGTIEKDEINTQGCYVPPNLLTYLKVKNPRVD